MDKSKLFENRLPEEDFNLEGIGVLKLRSLNRFEALLVAEAQTNQLRESKILKYGVVDPKLSDEDVEKWAKCSPGGEIEKVTEAIARLSGMLEGSEKEQFLDDGGKLIG